MRLALTLGGFLLLADALTKAALPNMSAGGGDPRDPGFSLGLVLAAAAIAVPWLRVPATVVAAGILGNLLWTVRPLGVPNPFVHGEGSYNVADVCIVVGGYATALMIVAWPVRLFVEIRR